MMPNVSEPELSFFTENQRLKAMQRFRTLQLYLEKGVPLKDIASKEGLSIRTIRRWLADYQRNGLKGLIRATRSDSGNPSEDLSKVKSIIEALALKRPKLSSASIFREVRKYATANELKPISYSTVLAVIKNIPKPLMLLAQEGTKAYKGKYDLILRRESSAANEIWQADHTLLDIVLLGPNEEPSKPWLTVILDDFSRAVAGYFITFDAPSAMNTALTLHQAIWRKSEGSWHICGIPTHFYTDHGSDFTSQHMEQVAADIKMQLIFSTIGEPRGRGKMERFFGTVNQLFLSTLPGYSPAGSENIKPALTLNDFEHLFKRWLLLEYMNEPHSETGERPQQRWEKSGFLPRLPESLEQLDLLLLTVCKPRVVHPDGIHFNNLRYVEPTLAPYVRESVIIRYDPRDLALIRVYHQGRFLCRAICNELAGKSVSLKDIVQARNVRRRELSKELRNRKDLVEKYISVHTASSVKVTLHDVEPLKSNLKKYLNE